MTEFITANPISGLNPHLLEVVYNSPISRGTEPKQLITAVMGYKEISLLERLYPDKDQLQIYIDNWLAFRIAGLPVVPTLRITDKPSLLLTNVKANGSEVYDKGMYDELINQSPYQIPVKRPTDSIFLDIMENSFKQICDQAEYYCNLANQKLIKLPSDDAFALVVHLNGKCELMILDLRFGGVMNKNTNPQYHQEVIYRNQESTQTFLNTIDLINSKIQSTQKPNPFQSFKRMFK